MSKLQPHRVLPRIDGFRSTVRLAERRTVARPPGEAFAYTADFANIQGWDPGVAASKALTAGPLGVGSRFEVVVRVGPGRLPMTYEITRFEPDRRVVLHGTGRGLDAIDDIRFDRQGDRTIIDYTADLTFHSPIRYLRPVLPVLPLLLRGVGRRAVDGLAAALGT